MKSFVLVLSVLAQMERFAKILLKKCIPQSQNVSVSTSEKHLTNELSQNAYAKIKFDKLIARYFVYVLSL